ncbi:MAG: hypothetical protein K0S32_1403 [Bacteroidetes bacterium]|jgi:methyl-accepting chemotaxis protein|nr:hypothetical protein [Bacteroidota bacterium]
MKKREITIKAKLIAYAVSIVLIMCLLGILFNRTIDNISLNQSINNEFKTVWIKTLELRKSEKDFMLRESTNMDFFETGRSKYAEQIDSTVSEAKSLLKELNETSVVKENNIEIANVSELFNQYHLSFRKLVEAKKRRGELDFGMIGEMRKAIRTLEDDANGHAKLMLQILTLRRYEKDYLLRKEMDYVDSHTKLIDEMMNNRAVSKTVKEKLVVYKNAFNAIVKIDAEIGVNEKVGLEGELRAAVHKVEPAIDEINKALTEALEADNRNSLITLLIIIVIGIIITIAISTYLIRSISRSLKYAVDSVGRIASGDLNQEIKIESRDEIGHLLEHMNLMTHKLKEIISSIRLSSVNIANASSQMNSSAQQMSQGATEQASSVEEISSSMEEMAANIQQNTSNAKQTEKIAQNASHEIIESNSAVLKTVSSMKTIANKISIIEEISRQTNLLALNAAVEAARAGEHGKGFAVVAAEVRKLAERSQHAAVEINEVSSQSVDVAQKSGDLLNSIVPNIQKTSDLIQEIAAASVEQNSGANQVNVAIQQLNQVVQENAATAEEMAAGAEELNAQAESLREIISFFKTGDEKKEQVAKKDFKIKPAATFVNKVQPVKTNSVANGKHNKTIDLNSDALEYEKY